ncbi:hypothetical protein CLV84_1475 [Neolewinella xylanilytica]|uniref:Uncharacterized protein n=1 Tax=Neolewinella xylanilytica TaxID=1514080 RepID=A0A2S6IAH4_9BACT|nr:hypothetical protein CLV84_1475 [Neolewinella xylanilytica]
MMLVLGYFNFYALTPFWLGLMAGQLIVLVLVATMYYYRNRRH